MQKNDNVESDSNIESQRFDDPDWVLVTQPEFISRDPRKDRYDRYNVNADFMTKRHRALLPGELLKDKSILDLGCCVGATAAWAFAHGARSYVGVEINTALCHAAHLNLYQYWHTHDWDIINMTVEQYFQEYGDERFDLVYYGGIIYADFDWIGQLEKLSQISDYIVMETFQPDIASYLDDEEKNFSKFLTEHPTILEKLENSASFVYLKEVSMFNGDQNSLLSYGSVPSMGALKQQMERLNYRWNTDCNTELQKIIPEWYHPRGRFGIHFYKEHDIDTNYLTVKELYNNPEKRRQRLVPWQTK
jgi:SAM-dependent methyltransferase